MLRTFLAILLAHLLADFPLQTDAVVLGKRSRKLPYLEHGAIHWAVLIALLFFFSNTLLWSTAAQMLIAGYIVFHLAVDVSKNWLVERKIFRDSTGLFLLDQAFHVAAVVALTWFFTRFHWSDVNAAVGWSDALQLHVLMVAVVYAAVIFGGGYLVRYLTRSLTLQLSGGEGRKYGGTAQRGLVYRVAGTVSGFDCRVGAVAGHDRPDPYWKVDCPPSELKGARFAEYFLIGTLFSISFALLGGILLLRVLVGAVSLK